MTIHTSQLTSWLSQSYFQVFFLSCSLSQFSLHHNSMNQFTTISWEFVSYSITIFNHCQTILYALPDYYSKTQTSQCHSYTQKSQWFSISYETKAKFIFITHRSLQKLALNCLFDLYWSFHLGRRYQQCKCYFSNTSWHWLIHSIIHLFINSEAIYWVQCKYFVRSRLIAMTMQELPSRKDR